MFSLIGAWKNDWANNGDAGDLRRHRAHYDVIVMVCWEDQLVKEATMGLAKTAVVLD